MWVDWSASANVKGQPFEVKSGGGVGGESVEEVKSGAHVRTGENSHNIIIIRVTYVLLFYPPSHHHPLLYTPKFVTDGHVLHDIIECHRWWGQIIKMRTVVITTERDSSVNIFHGFFVHPHQSSSTGGGWRWSAEDEAEPELIGYGFFLFFWINLNPSLPYYFICRLPEMSSSLSPRTALHWIHTELSVRPLMYQWLSFILFAVAITDCPS